MAIDITIPSPGESISEVVVGAWHKADGDWVEKDEALVEIESDKVTLEIPAPESGLLSIRASEGKEMHVGEVVGSIDPTAQRAARAKPAEAARRAAPAPAARRAAEAPASGAGAAAKAVEAATESVADGAAEARGRSAATPLARKVAADRGVALEGLRGTGPSGRITKSDVLAVGAPAAEAAIAASRVVATTMATRADGRGTRRVRMSRLRQRIAERLVEAQHGAAMLTTFNEADMTEVMRLRGLHKDRFSERHGVGLGFMSFFVRACVSALGAYEGLNAYLDGDEIEYHDFIDVSIAVGTPKGLVVPVIRDAHRLSFAEIELAIKDLATRGRDGKLTLDEMTGGTFTITNGGIYGSLMSTPILNPPQSGILGMHKIMTRPVEDPQKPGQIALRPMMYLALSYDHRIVDGEQAVRFLVRVKECLESPDRMLLDV
jgi:2-oxoglutarate dehydrogenase E2 component (dihydrolipoamide succinyltransferase)